MWRRWGTTQKLFLAFTDELEKQIFIKKLLKWANKKQNNLNIFNAAFFWKKIKTSTNRYHYFTPVHKKSWSYDLQFLRHGVWQTPLVILSFFALLPHKNLKKKNFEKMKQIAGDINILHMCTKNHNHMMYNFWDTECDRQDFLSFWAIFSIFPTNNPSNKNFEKMK